MGERSRSEPGSFCWVGSPRPILPGGGMRQQVEREHGTPPSWLPYFRVESAADSARKAEREGGRVPVAGSKTTIAGCAIVADPQGAAFGLCER
jgi:predicted enzyme related to lactoylglutathione lyase